MLLLLMEGSDTQALAGPDVLTSLRALGISDVVVLRDRHGVAIALTGWAFDPERHAIAATDLVADGRAMGRVLYPLAHMSLTAEIPAQTQEPPTRRQT